MIDAMTPETKSRLLTAAEVAGLVVVVVIVGVIVNRIVASRLERGDVRAPGSTTTVSGTVSDVPADIRVPEAGEEPTGDVAVPNAVVDAAPGVEAKARSYAIAVERDAFSPATVIVRAGDTTSIRFTAKDKDYDFVQPDLGLSAKLLKGKEQLIQVSPSEPGRFTFFCKACGGPDRGPVGYLIVAPN